jgi:hypothetical protein
MCRRTARTSRGNVLNRTSSWPVSSDYRKDAKLAKTKKNLRCMQIDADVRR